MTIAWMPRALLILFAAFGLLACGGESASVNIPVATSTGVPPAPQTARATATHPAPTATNFANPQPTPATATFTPQPTAVLPTTFPNETRPFPTPEPTTQPLAAEEPPLIIVLDPGHDRSIPGALGIEYQMVLQTAYVAKAALEAAGYEVHLTREDNDFVFSEHPELLPPNAADMHPGYGAAYAHATKALEFEPDMVIMLHYNGHPSADARGMEIYYCELGGPQNLMLAGIVRDELVVALRTVGYETPSTRIEEDIVVARGNRHFPSKGNVYDPPTTWVANRYTGIPVVLTEPLYMTNPIERPFLDDAATHQAISGAYVRTADRYFSR